MKKSLGEQLAEIGEAYLRDYPQPVSSLWFLINRHTNQRQARSLIKLHDKPNHIAWEKAHQLLRYLNDFGELSQNIIAVLDQYNPFEDNESSPKNRGW